MWQLVINGPGYFDTNYDLPQGVTQLGRADENDIVLSGDLVSRKHARLYVSSDSVAFEDLGSRNGSRLNDKPIEGKVPVLPGDRLILGENVLLIRQPTPAEKAATEVVDLNAGGSVRRYGRGLDIARAVMMTREVSNQVMSGLLDEFASFEKGTIPPVTGSLPSADQVTPRPVSPSSRGSTLAWQSLWLLYRVAQRLNSAPTLNVFLDEAMNGLMKRVGATTGVVLIRHATGVMVPASVCHAGKLQSGEVPVSDAIIDAALSQGQAIAVGNVHTDSRFSGRESVMVYGVDQVLCVPIGVQAPFQGVLYLNRPATHDEPIERLLDLCSVIGQMVQTGLVKFQAAPVQIDRVRVGLERFLKPEIAERWLAEQAGVLNQLAEHQVTVMVADIAGFAELTQRGPVLHEILGDFARVATSLIFSFEGTVATLTGDHVTALFGAPYSRGDDAIRAVRAAMALKTEWSRLTAKRPAVEQVQLRVGLHTGKVLAGTVGSQARLDYAAIGEPVHIASWLCSSASPGQVLLTGKSLASIGARFDVTPLGERPLFGSKARTAVFEVLDEDSDSGTTLSGL